MESSTVLAFRIFVMLSCLIIVPMAAIFGSAFPDVVKSVLVDRIVAWSTGKPAESGDAAASPGATSQAPLAVADTAGEANHWDAPRWPAQGEPAGGGPGAPAAWQSGGVVPASVAAVPQQGGNQSAGFVAESNQADTTGYPSRRATAEMPTGPGGVAGGAPQPLNYPVHNPASSGSTPRPLDQPDPFTSMERKLREYGATYYLLETWGSAGDLYRFHCRMAVSNNPNYTRHFEATDRDALQAMSQVLSRVEAWRAGRLQ